MVPEPDDGLMLDPATEAELYKDVLASSDTASDSLETMA